MALHLEIIGSRLLAITEYGGFLGGKLVCFFLAVFV